MPEDANDLRTKLIEVQKELKAPKTRTNTFAKYNYRSAEDILEAVKPLLHKHGLLLTISDEILEIGGRVYVRAAATVGDGKDVITVTAYAREDEAKKGYDAAQLTGATSSYSRKYCLNGLFLIDDDKDPDTDEHHRQTHDAPQTSTIAPERTKPSHEASEDVVPHSEQPIRDNQKRQLFALATEIAKKNGWNADWLKSDLYGHFRVDSTSKLTTAQGAKVIAALYQVRDKNAVFLDALGRAAVALTDAMEGQP